ncbi:hypothetical protein HHK36_026404 [Tetracentron sinense]|uniref:DUF4371 domain-containing protein n=1 Tax=Tetracentron sinense TaxID=13715 RepID=A0A834YEY5_TETSI|nr:hypothetical protein HHK36_026404 [Tetracentron sinense]
MDKFIKRKSIIDLSAPTLENDDHDQMQPILKGTRTIRPHSNQSDQDQREYQVRLNASIDCIRLLLRRGLALCGHDEFGDQENFLELLRFLMDHNETIKSAVLQHAPENPKLTASDIQKDIMSVAAIEITNTIINEVGDSLFAILIDESCDIFFKLHITVVLRYVDKRGFVIERFLGIVHAIEFTIVSLKAAIDELLSKHGLSITRLRGQSYDGASNLHDEFGDLKTLITNENESAFYVHCFAHQLQLTLIVIAKNHSKIWLLFKSVSNLLNIVGVPCKHRDILREEQVAKVIEVFKSDEFSSGQGLACLIVMFSSVIDVFDIVVEDGLNSEDRDEAWTLLNLMQSFEFALTLHLMRNILEITNELSKALQQKEQDIVDVMTLVKFVAQGRSRCKDEEIKNLQHYRAKLFYTTIDMLLKDLNNRVTEVNIELLLCVACPNPSNSFCAFDKQKLVRLAEFYPIEFSTMDLMALDNQLEIYIIDMHSNNEFSNVKGICGLPEKMVKTKKDILYPLVYLLVTLALILPVFIATIEKTFSAMKIRIANRRLEMAPEDVLRKAEEACLCILKFEVGFRNMSPDLPKTQTLKSPWLNQPQKRVNQLRGGSLVGPNNGCCTRQHLEEVTESIKTAEEVCAAEPVSGECAAAWGGVEELSAAASDERLKKNTARITLRQMSVAHMKNDGVQCLTCLL